jgi:hypothetical protein
LFVVRQANEFVHQLAVNHFGNGDDLAEGQVGGLVVAGSGERGFERFFVETGRWPPG